MVFNILYLTTHNPCGEVYGAQLRALHIGRALGQLGSVTLVYVNEARIAKIDIEAAKKEFRHIKILHLSDTSEQGLFRYAKRNLSPGLRNSLRLSCKSEELRKFLKWAAENDLIWFFGLRIPSALDFDTKFRTFVDIDDIRSRVISSQASCSIKWITRFKFNVQAMIWRYRESRLPKMFYGLGVSSEADRGYLGKHPSIHVIPNGFQRPERFPQRSPVSPPRIGFIGTLDYYPNSDGILWFIKRVFPIIKNKCQSVVLRLIGSRTNEGIGNLERGINGLGYIKDPTVEIESWSLMVVPIFVGGGTRIKIAEGFSRKCPVVATSIGVYGYEVSDGKELLIADDAQTFAEACLKIITKPTEAAQMADRAYKKFLEKWTWEAINPRVWAAVEYCMQRRSFT